MKAFAEKRGYKLRAVYRSRDLLVKVGAPIHPNPELRTRWQLMPGWLPASVVGAAKEELIALFVARQLAPGLRGTSVGRSLDSLWAKLTSTGTQQALPLEIESPLSIRTLSAIDYADHRSTVDCLTEAIERRHAVRIRYRTPGAAISERVIEPGALHWDGALEAMYVPSWCRLREAIRVFAVHRILSIEPLRDEPSRKTIRTLERAFRVWYRDKVEHVQIRFTASVAGEIRERRWHASQRLVESDDGSVYLHLDVSAPEELARWLLGFAANARVIEPARLAEEIRRQHEAAAGSVSLMDQATPMRTRSAPRSGSTVRARRSP